MKLGVFTALFQDQSLEKALELIKEFGAEAVSFLKEVMIREKPGQMWWT